MVLLHMMIQTDEESFCMLAYGSFDFLVDPPSTLEYMVDFDTSKPKPQWMWGFIATRVIYNSFKEGHNRGFDPSLRKLLIKSSSTHRVLKSILKVR